jgi:hypothetical protein
MNSLKSDTSLITSLNFFGVITAYVLLALSLYLSTDVPLATKGYWGMAVLMLTICLVNFVKYRFEAMANEDRIRQLEEAKNERLLAEFVTDPKKV